MAFDTDPELMRMMTLCCVDKFKRNKLMPFYLPSQAKFYPKVCDKIPEQDLLEYFKSVEVRVGTAFWPTTTPTLEATVNSPVFQYMCDSIIDEVMYYNILEELYKNAKSHKNDIFFTNAHN